MKQGEIYTGWAMLKCTTKDYKHTCHWRTREGRCTLFDSGYLNNWKQYQDVCKIGQRMEKHVIDLGIPDPKSDVPDATLHATMWRKI